MKQALCIACCALALALGVGCGEKPQPLLASSTGSSTYAERYPEALAQGREQLGSDEATARDSVKELSSFPEEVKDAPPQHVLAVVRLADAEGRSASYVQRLEETQHVARFLEDNKESLHAKVGGAAQYAAKGCNPQNVSGAVNHALDKELEKQLEEHLHEASEAHRYIDDNEEEIGKANAGKLRKQADKLSHTSYLVHIQPKQTEARLRAMIGEAEEVEKTLDRTIKESDEIENSDATDTRKEKARERKKAAKSAKERIASEIESTEERLKQNKERADKLEAEYDAALKKLEEKLGGSEAADEGKTES